MCRRADKSVKQENKEKHLMATVGTLTASEEAQLQQTVEMFEEITKSQPQDYQSLEILKEAYQKLGRDTDVANTSKRIAQAYVLMGQLSSAILEYESVLQRCPDDPEVLAALHEIENKIRDLKRMQKILSEVAVACVAAKPISDCPILKCFEKR